jgi:nicotinate dehydrogenase subunit B
MGVELRVNGREVAADVGDTTPLMYVLRNELGMKGVRAGCSIGECGACTVILDGEAIRSCLTPVSEAVGRDVVTPEGLGGPDDPHPVQQAFIDEQAAQCGYCVNGMIMTVAATVAAHPDADDATLLAPLDEHICRCGTHDRLRRAALRAAGRPSPASWDAVEVAVPDATDAPARPAALSASPRVDAWLRVGADGRFELRAGRVELGQGIRSTLELIAAAHLGVPHERVVQGATATDRVPDEGYTSASLSTEDGGLAVAAAATALRRLLREAAAGVLGTDVHALLLDADGVHVATDPARRVGFAELVALLPPDAVIADDDLPVWAPQDGFGAAPARSDLAHKLTGAAAYVHDMDLPGMLHARAFLPPSLGATTDGLDLAAARSADGVVELVVDGQLVIVIAEREHQAIQALGRLARGVRWSGGETSPASVEDLLRSLDPLPFPGRREGDVDAALAAAEGSGHVRRATYTRAYQAHGPMAGSAAVAQEVDGTLTVFTHAQGIHPLRRELATLLALDLEHVVVEHRDGPGCYGFNGADDAAAFAAIAARAVPGRPVRFQFSLQDEFGWEPYGPAMLADLTGAVDDTGRLSAWRHRTITDIHSVRPEGSGDRLAPSWLRADASERPWTGPAESGIRNAHPLYALPSLDVVADHVRGPLRTGALRSLGSHLNVFAMESFVDELAEAAGSDPLAFRLAHLEDPRARRVLEVAAERAGWQEHVGPSGRGQGIALARYKDSKAYVGLVADVRIDPERGTLEVTRLTMAADAGLVIDEGGLRNQLEGGLLQGLSRTLHEGLTLGRAGVVERDWTTYPVLRFRDVPELDIVLVRGAGTRPLGAGESSTPAVAPAVANAVDDALGVRLRALPFGPDALERRLLELEGDEAARVLL